MFEVREKPRMVERAYVVGVAVGAAGDVAGLLEELKDLVATLGIGVVGEEIVKVREPQAKFLMGAGKMAAIVEAAQAVGADCLVLDAELTPGQQRNWESASGLCVIDRQEVIIDIFSDRAQTKEAVLQVALARAEHSLPRLKNAWTHLSRQRGGGGVTQRGEGEAQIELDARMVRQRIARLKRELTEVVQHRETQRKQRQRVPVPTAALVGYTNAGKSTLLNRWAGADVLSADQLFATLDPTTRHVRLGNGLKLLLTDTVGFVRRLPHQLVNAFRATLEEAVLVDILLHVVDVSHPECVQQAETTLEVLTSLGADMSRVITVFNKIDQWDGSEFGLGDADGLLKNAIHVSALTGEGLADLEAACEAKLQDRVEARHLLIPHARYDLVHRLYANGAIKSEKVREEGVEVFANVPARMLAQFEGYCMAPPVETVN